MDIEAICAGLASAAGTISGLTAVAQLPTTINTLPLFAPIEWSTEYDKTFGGMTENPFTVQVFASRTGDSKYGRQLVVEYANPTGTYSIKSALEADRTLGGACKTLIVERAKGAARLYTVGTDEFLGVQFDVRVWA